MRADVLILKGEFTDLNNYINFERTNKYIAHSIKKTETERVWLECKSQNIGKQKDGVFIVFQWFMKDKRKDKDNIAFAKKFILDGLVLAGVLKSDGFDYISGFLDVFYLDPDNPRVEISFINDPEKIEIKEYIDMTRKKSS